MYEAWQVKRWDTPISDVGSLVMASLVDDGVLSIILEAPRFENRPRWQFTFEAYPAYCNILEEYRLKLWDHLSQSKQRCGSTFIVDNSPWIAAFYETEFLLEVHYPDLNHYVISTEDDVIEILAPSVEVICLGDTPLSVPSVGKSRILYNPDLSRANRKII